MSTHLIFLLTLFVIVDVPAMKVFERLDDSGDQGKFWLGITIIAVVLTVEHYYLIKFVMVNLKYFDINLMARKNNLNDFLLLIFGFSPELLMFATAKVTDRTDRLKH